RVCVERHRVREKNLDGVTRTPFDHLHRGSTYHRSDGPTNLYFVVIQGSWRLLMIPTLEDMTEPARSDPTSGGHAQPGQHGPGHAPRSRKELAWLSLGALGVVYGDIGT